MKIVSASTPVSSGPEEIAGAFSRALSRIKEAVDRLCKLAIKGSNGCERNLDEAVLPRSFHQLRDSVYVIEVHYDIEARCTGYAYDLTELGKTSEYMIRFNDNSRNGGTHWTPQQ